MPHITIAFPAPFADVVRERELVRIAHQAAVDTGEFPVNGIRTFADPVEDYRVGNGKPDNVFVQVQMRIAPGRDLARRQRIAQAVFAAIDTALAPAFAAGRLALQVEVTEFDAAVTLQHNGLEPG